MSVFDPKRTFGRLRDPQLRGMARTVLRKSKRALDDAVDQVLVREPSLGRRRSETRRWIKKRVWVYVDDEGRAGRIDTKIEASIAAQPEQDPRRQCELLERLGNFRLNL